MVRIVATSDTHCSYPEPPPGDIFIHAGDWTFLGQREEIEANQAWLDSQKHKFKHMIGVAGNHDFLFHKGTFNGVSFLFDEEINIEGLRIWGTPVVPRYGDWAFMASEEVLYNFHYSKIPEGLDILICHGPALGFVDKNMHGDLCGSEALRRRLMELKQPPKYFIFGHIHMHYRQIERVRKYRGITFINVSYLDERYSKWDEPVVIDIDANLR